MTIDPKFNLDPKFVAGVQLIERTGARNFRIGYSDEDDGDPIVWYACATWGLDPQTGRPLPKGGRISQEAAAAIHPVTAVLRLCEQIIDGGHCVHCGQRTIFDDNPTDSPFDDLLDVLGCVYAWDPELSTFRRGCEGDG